MNDSYNDIDDYVLSRMEKEHVPGLALALAEGGDLKHARGYGLANVELGVPVETQTVFQIGSITKQFTAAGILLLIEEGKLDLDGNTTKFLGGLELPPAWREITVRQLLTHTAGLPDVTELPEFSYYTDYSKEELVKLVAAHPLKFSPGEEWSYSNMNYVLLGWMIEALSGETYGKYLKRCIFEPLGMTSTRTIHPEEIVAQRGFGYCWKGELENGSPARPSVIMGAGGILSTVVDLAKWDAALYTDTPLSEESKRLMWSPARLNDGSPAETEVSCGNHYGFGWFLGEYRGRKLVSHTGETDAGFNSEIIRFYEDRKTIIVLCNLEPVEQDELSKGIADRWFF